MEEYTYSNEWSKTGRCQQMDLESHGSWPTVYAQN